MSANSFLRDDAGASLVEFLLIIPLLLAMTFSVVDMGVLMWQWNQAAKATQFGARFAAMNNPVATNMNLFTNPGDSDTSFVGMACVDPATGARRMDLSGQPLCPDRTSVCTSTGCTNGITADAAAFTAVANEMRNWLPILAPENLRITYSTIGLGFVDRPGGAPMAVTVSLRCLGVPLIWLDQFFAAPAGCAGFTGAPVPAFATTRISEDLANGW
jgi:hypothetical protein